MMEIGGPKTDVFHHFLFEGFPHTWPGILEANLRLHGVFPERWVHSYRHSWTPGHPAMDRWTNTTHPTPLQIFN